jgi:hypothetical protein
MLVFDARGKKRSEFTSDTTGTMLAFEHAGWATSRIASLGFCASEAPKLLMRMFEQFQL